jgi:release factor glutamine methyltransferase
MMKIANWLQSNTIALKAVGIESARLDCIILLEDVLNVDRVHILTHSEESIPINDLTLLENKIQRRLQREPLAYIRGYNEFYGRNFVVNSAVLVPRPESEAIIEIVKSLHLPCPKIIDIGTGSGALAVTLKLELKDSEITATDVSEKALAIAQENAQKLDADITFCSNDLLENTASPFNVIVANLPYVSHDQEVSIETTFEPEQALFAENDGYALIERLLTQINSSTLSKTGYLLLESEPRQHARIQKSAADNSLILQSTEHFIQLYSFK